METLSFGETDDHKGEFYSETGEAAGENKEISDDHLLHGHHTPTRLHHRPGLKDLGIEIVPEAEDKKRKRMKR